MNPLLFGLVALVLLSFSLTFRERKVLMSLTDEEQGLQRDIDSYSAPEALQQRARELGMMPGGDPAFLNPNGTVKGVPSVAGEQAVNRAVEQSAVQLPLVLLPPEPAAAPPAPSTPPTPEADPAQTTTTPGR